MRLFVVEPLDTGGMIHYAYQLCTALSQEGANVTLLTGQGYEPAGYPHQFTVIPLLNLWPAYDRQTAHPLRRFFRRPGRGLRHLQQWHKLTNYLIAQKPDLIQFGKINFPFEALFLARLRRRGIPLAQICHEFELREQGNGWRAKLGSRLYQAVYAQFDLIFFHGQANRQHFASLFHTPHSQLLTIPHGNEMIFHQQHGGPGRVQQLAHQYQLTEGQPVVLFFGNLTPSKGLPDLLEAFALVQQHLNGSRLIVAGYPTKYISLDNLKGQASRLGITNSLVWDSRYLPVADVGPLMELATVVVYPYWNSTQSGSLQVAYAFSRPVIATRVGGLPEAVDEGRSGLLVEAHNPPALAQALLSLLQQPEQATAMGHYARRMAESRFAWRPIAHQILESYAPLLL